MSSNRHSVPSAERVAMIGISKETSIGMENVQDYADASLAVQMPRSTQLHSHKDISITQSLSRRNHDGSGKKIPAAMKSMKIRDHAGK